MTDRDRKFSLRKALVALILPFAALGVAGCDDTEPADDGIEEEMPMDQEQEGEQEQEDEGEQDS